MPKPTKERLNTQVIPEPALEKRTRRQFKPEYKLPDYSCSRCLSARRTWRTTST
jgi:hypothetical protein